MNENDQPAPAAELVETILPSRRDEAGATNLAKAREAKARIAAADPSRRRSDWRRNTKAAKDFARMAVPDGPCCCGRSPASHALRANGKRGGVPGTQCGEYFERGN